MQMILKKMYNRFNVIYSGTKFTINNVTRYLLLQINIVIATFLLLDLIYTHKQGNFSSIYTSK